MTRRKKIKLVDKKLGRERALGQACSSDNIIEIDPRLRPKIRLSVAIHEALHVVFPDMSESKINRSAPKIAQMIWDDGYRRIQK